MDFDSMWEDIATIGRRPETGGYLRLAWTPTDLALREWFAAAAHDRGLDVVVDRSGNQWAWWGDPDVTPGVVAGSHLDSVADGGAFDGPLGIVSAFSAVDALREAGYRPSRPIGVVNFSDEEGTRFGVACMGSRLLTGALSRERALGLRDGDGVTFADALRAAGRSTDVGRDDVALRRVATFVELHIEQGRALVDLNASVGVASAIWPHGRFRADLTGEANHAGTTRLVDRRDPVHVYAQFVLAARDAAERNGTLTTCGKVLVEPNSVNAIAAHVTAWLDARGPVDGAVRATVDELATFVAHHGGTLTRESWTDETPFDPALRERIVGVLGGPPVLATGAGHDAGILATYGIPAGMLFVRNPSGVSHSPAEFAERDDCLAGVRALTTVLEELAS